MWKYIKSKFQSSGFFSLTLIFFFYLLLSVLFFHEILFSPGIVVGQDWLFPYNTHQMERYMERPFYTWTYDMNLFGVKNPFSVQMPFVFLVKLFTLIGLDGIALSKIFILLVFSLSGTSMFALLRFLGLRTVAAGLGGFMLITMPVFFNYTVMGWCFVLFSVGVVLPVTVILFIRAVEENNIRYALIAGLLYALAILQSQSLVWYPMVFSALFFFLVKSRSSFLAYLRTFCIIVGIALALHSTWWPNLLINQDPGVMNSDLVLDSVSQGMRSRLSFVNILRGWGSLFNQPYELSYPQSINSLSYLIPFLALASLVFRRIGKRDIRVPLVIVVLYLFALFAIDPGTMSKIPFSNLIRDTARFTALTTFAFVVLASYFLHAIFESTHPKKKIFAALAVFLLFINALPFVSGALTEFPRNEYDVRMRNYVFPEEYRKAENYLYTVLTDTKSYYPPSGTNIGVKDLPMYHGDFREIKDPFRAYSPLPGTTYMYYSSMGKPTKVSSLLESLFYKKITDASLSLIGLLNIGYLIIRNDTVYPEAQADSLADLVLRSAADVRKFGDVIVFKNPFTYPHFYVPDILVYTPNAIDALSDIVAFHPYPARLGVYLGQENLDNDSVVERAQEIFLVANELNQKKYELYVPRDGSYILALTENTEVTLSGIPQILTSAGKNLKKTENGLLEWGKVDLKEGWHALSLSYRDLPGLLASTAWEPKIVLRSAQNTEPAALETITLPQITFTRINPTKYRIQVSGAEHPYTLVFSESYHDGWALFLSDPGQETAPGLKNRFLKLFGKIGSGLTTLFGEGKHSDKDIAVHFDGAVREGEHRTTFLEPATFETWGNKLLVPEAHTVINGYANSWYITPADVGERKNYELVVEFVPQRVFYMGFLLAVFTLFCALGGLGYFVYRKKKEAVKGLKDRAENDRIQ